MTLKIEKENDMWIIITSAGKRIESFMSKNDAKGYVKWHNLK